MLNDYLGQQPGDMDDDRLTQYVEDLRVIVQDEYEVLPSDGDTGFYETRVAQLRQATSIAKGRGLDVPPAP